jgi:hypothetical protein
MKHAEQTEVVAPEPLLPIARHLHGAWRPVELAHLEEVFRNAKRRRATEDDPAHGQKAANHLGRPSTKRARTIEDQARDEAGGGVDWHWVIEEMGRLGSSRSRHQILCKAVELGFKGEPLSSVRSWRARADGAEPLIRRGRKAKRKRGISEQLQA